MNRATRIVGVIVAIAGLLTVLSLLPGWGTEALAQETNSMSLPLTPSRDSGVSGGATLTEVEGGVKVELNVRGLPEAGIEHINHVHTGGTCAADRAGNVAPATIPLETIVANEDGTGSGTTTLEDVTMDSLFDPGKERYIALHSEVKEDEGVPPVISCADVVKATGGGAGSGDLPETGGPLPVMLLAAAAILALGAAGGVVKLVRCGF